MAIFAVPQSGFALLWPYMDLGNDKAVAMYSVGCRKDNLPMAAYGYALSISTITPSGVRIDSQRLKSQWLVNAREEAINRAQGRTATLFKAVARGRLTVWERIEQLVDARALTDDARTMAKEIRSDGVLIEKANPRNAVTLAQFSNRLATTVTYELQKMVKAPLRQYVETMMGYYPGKRFEDLSQVELDRMWRAGQTVLEPGLRAGYGLAAEQITQQMQLSIVDIADQNREFLRKNFIPRIANSFEQPDVEAIQQIGTQGGFWIRDSSGQISQSIDGNARKIIEEGLRQGQGRDEIGKMLMDRVPEIWQRHSLNYARTVAANAVSRARSYSEVASYSSVGIEYLEVVAMLDERTTDICRTLDGTIIEVKSALDHQKRIAALQNPTDIVTAAPFMREQTDKKTGEKHISIGQRRFATVSRSGYGAPDDRGDFKRFISTKKMVKSGVSMPPYHHQCRTMTVARVEMVQVPAGYEPQAEAVASTNDEKAPVKTAPSKPKQRQQQRPVSMKPVPSDKKPVSAGQKAKHDPKIKKTPAAEPKKTRQKPKAIGATKLSQYNAKTQNELSSAYGGKTVKVTNIEYDNGNGVLKYTYKNPDFNGADATWYTMVPKDQRDLVKAELDKASRITVQKPPKLKPKTNHAVANMGKSNQTLKQARTQKEKYTERFRNFDTKKEWEARARIGKGLESDSRFEAYSKKYKVNGEQFHDEVKTIWNRTSKDTDEKMHLLQMAAQEEFGLPKKTLASLDEALMANIRRKKDFGVKMDAYKAYVRAHATDVQERMKKEGVKKITLYRGVRFSSAQQPGVPTGATMLGRLEDGLSSTQPISSYSADYEVAQRFAMGSQYGAVIKQEVPIERIISNVESGLGAGPEREFLIMGGEDEIAQLVSWNREKDTFANLADIERTLFE